MLHSETNTGTCSYGKAKPNELNVNENADGYVFRKFINAAIYVEKTIQKINEHDKSDNNGHANYKITKTKRCSCYINPEHCSCHPIASRNKNKVDRSCKRSSIRPNTSLDVTQRQKIEELDKKIREEKEILEQKRLAQNKKTRPHSIARMGRDNYFSERNSFEMSENKKTEDTSSKKVSYCKRVEMALQTDLPLEDELSIDIPNEEYEESDDSIRTFNSNIVTIKRSDKIMENDIKLSLSSLTSFQPAENDTVRQWLNKKLEEKKKEKEMVAKLQEKKEMERQILLEKERENFRQWLANKKKENERKKLDMERQIELEKLNDLEKEKRHLQNEINFQIWLQQKKQALIEKKKQEHIKILETRIEKEQRLLRNEEAFQDWLQSSKFKPKPIPLNRGLESLRSSSSVTYVNPIPWVPNIQKKPYSQ